MPLSFDRLSIPPKEFGVERYLVKSNINPLVLASHLLFSLAKINGERDKVLLSKAHSKGKIVGFREIEIRHSKGQLTLDVASDMVSSLRKRGKDSEFSPALTYNFTLVIKYYYFKGYRRVNLRYDRYLLDMDILNDGILLSFKAYSGMVRTTSDVFLSMLKKIVTDDFKDEVKIIKE